MNNVTYIGVSGFARTGKNLYCSIAKRILEKKGCVVEETALANELKNEVDEFCKEKYGISSWTQDSCKKEIIRKILVAHGCIMRDISNGEYWIKKIDDHINKLNSSKKIDYVLVSDIRFENEVNYIHKLNGKVIHLSKYHMELINGVLTKRYQLPPNEEEKVNDPIISKLSDYNLEWGHVGGNALDNQYLNDLVDDSLKQLCI